MAVLALILSLITLVWQLLSFFLSGPRITVTLNFWVVKDDGTGGMGWSAGSRNPAIAELVAADHTTRELVEVLVRNNGRSPATIVRTGVAAGRITFLRYSTTAVGYDDEPVRLEGGGGIHTFRADAWPLIDRLRELRPSEPISLTAAVELGSGKIVHSTVRRAIEIPSSMTSIVPGRADGCVPPNRSGPADERRPFTNEIRGLGPRRR